MIALFRCCAHDAGPSPRYTRRVRISTRNIYIHIHIRTFMIHVFPILYSKSSVSVYVSSKIPTTCTFVNVVQVLQVSNHIHMLIANINPTQTSTKLQMSKPWRRKLDFLFTFTKIYKHFHSLKITGSISSSIQASSLEAV